MPEADALSPERLLADPIGAGPIGRRRPAQPALERFGAGRRAGPGAERAGLCRHGRCHRRAVARAARHGPGDGRPPATPPSMAVVRYAGALTSIDELNSQASGWGLISVDTTRGIVRRIPLVASVQGTLVPTLAVEMLRVAYHAPVIRLTAAGAVGDQPERGPDARDDRERWRGARLLLDASRRSFRLGDRRARGPGRSGAAAQAAGADRPDRVRPAGAPGHADRRAHVGQRDPGPAAREPARRHAAAAGRAGRRPPRRCSSWCAARCWSGRCAALAPAQRGIADARPASRCRCWAHSASTAPSACCSMRRRRASTCCCSSACCSCSPWPRRLASAGRSRASCRASASGPRESPASSRRRSASRPPACRARTCCAATSASICYAALTPAREVGGDLYDYFMLDDDRLFLLIGDVAGKGLSASIFMAVSKALYKGADAPHARAPTSATS